MNRIEYDGEVLEQDLWRLFSKHPDQPSDTILFFSQLKPLLKSMKFEDESRYYHLYESDVVSASATNARWRATVAQKNLHRVATAMSKACSDVAIQYVGPQPTLSKPVEALAKSL